MLHEGCPGERLTQPHRLAVCSPWGWPRFPVVHHLRPESLIQAMYRQSRGKEKIVRDWSLMAPVPIALDVDAREHHWPQERAAQQQPARCGRSQLLLAQLAEPFEPAQLAAG